MPKPKKGRTKKSENKGVRLAVRKRYLAWLFLPALLIAVVYGVGYYRAQESYAPPVLASGAQIEDARSVIISKYLSQSTIECDDPSDPVTPRDRETIFYKYLRVNRYANRAVIRGCNNIDALLAKTKTGLWERTRINVALDARVNPTWQKACLIEDITVADNVVRPENNSIDSFNLRDCNHLRQYNQVKEF